ncbi:MAG TPA: DHA2 family efflux MFS transporter permease subunit [Candidatus Binataceae bacterium]|nr:DHA2 family efflux MFS transporter permease subunit [Candidatus Binataceae bacterium]
MSAAPRAIAPVRVKPRHNPWAIALTVTMATFMEILDTSIANVSLPHIAGGLSSSVDESTWILTAYLVANAIVLPISAWITGRVGRKRFYMTCVALFTASSFLCGIAPSLTVLICARVMQGAGGGGLQPSEQAILSDTFPPEKFGMAFAVYGMAVVLAPAIGPTLGGFITDNFSWRWIFFINVPVGLISLLLTYRMVDDPPYMNAASQAAARKQSVDYIGLGLIALGLGCLQVVLDKGQEDDWFQSHFIAILSVIAVAALLIFVLWEWRQQHPILDLKLFRSRSFAIAALMMFVLGVVLYGSTTLLPLFLQELLGYTAQLSGFVLSPGALAILVLMPVVGTLIGRFEARWLAGIGFAISALALFHMCGLDLKIDFRTAMMYRIYQSVGLAFLFIPINTAAFASATGENSNQISSLANLFRNIGGSVGISMCATLVARRSQIHQDTLARHITNYDGQFRSMRDGLSTNLSHSGFSQPDALHQSLGRIYGMVQQQAAAQAYIDTFWLLAVACLCMLPLVLLMGRNDPHKAMTAH